MALPTCTTDGCFKRPSAMDDFECAPTATDGEITEILIASTPFTDTEIADAAEMESRINNTPTTALHIVRLKVTGKLNAPEVSETEVEGGAKIQSSKKGFSVDFDFWNDSDTNYEAVRAQMHCGKPSLLYFVMGGKIYGGTANVEDGISTVLNLLPSSEGKDSYLKYTGKFAWRATTLPKRAAFVLAS